MRQLMLITIAVLMTGCATATIDLLDIRQQNAACTEEGGVHKYAIHGEAVVCTSGLERADWARLIVEVPNG